jgi:hypothetical protein
MAAVADEEYIFKWFGFLEKHVNSSIKAGNFPAENPAAG